MRRELHGDAPPIFIGGAGRSGTTLLRVILDSHPAIACGPELKVLPELGQLWHTFQSDYRAPLARYGLDSALIDGLFREMILGLLEGHRRGRGKARIAEKSPNNVFVFAHLHQMFPESPLVHVIRDGRDVVASLLRMEWTASDGEPLAYTQDAGQAARYWCNAVNAGRMVRESRSMARRYCEVRYEELVTAPTVALTRLFAQIGEPWDPTVLAFHKEKRELAGESSAAQVARPLYQSSIGRWRQALTPAQCATVKETAGELLIELGYAEGLAW